MKLNWKDRKQMVVGAQAYRTAIRRKDGRVEFSFHALPQVNVRTHIEVLKGRRVTNVGVAWLIWGAEIYAYAVEVPRKEQEKED